MTQNKRQKAEAAGRWAERYAGLILALKGYKILATRQKLSSGELDIICLKGGLVVIIEVKKRARLNDAKDAVSMKNWVRIGRAADLWLSRHGDLYNADRRYDLFAIATSLTFCHIRDAWRPDFPLTHG